MRPVNAKSSRLVGVRSHSLPSRAFAVGHVRAVRHAAPSALTAVEKHPPPLSLGVRTDSKRPQAQAAPA
jgi:hypothetical protein